jgi:signal transduction histidine kinase
MVFDKFFTVESRAPSERKGVGLGLAFCKQVIEAHEGQIWVKSPLYIDERGQERGCELSFLLPAGMPLRSTESEA